jgi:hypothetical protein
MLVKAAVILLGSDCASRGSASRRTAARSRATKKALAPKRGREPHDLSREPNCPSPELSRVRPSSALHGRFSHRSRFVKKERDAESIAGRRRSQLLVCAALASSEKPEAGSLTQNGPLVLAFVPPKKKEKHSHETHGSEDPCGASVPSRHPTLTKPTFKHFFRATMSPFVPIVDFARVDLLVSADVHGLSAAHHCLAFDRPQPRIVSIRRRC